MQIQISIGTGSLGLVYREVTESDLAPAIAQCAAQTGYTPEVVTEKLLSGGTLWLNRANDQKIRGYDADAAARRAKQRDHERAVRLAADDYLTDH